MSADTEAKAARQKTAKKAKPAKGTGTASRPPTRQFNQERLALLLLAPVVSEKGTYLADKHEQVIFKVMLDATKPEVKAAVETMFKVQVDKVQIVNVGGKIKRFGRFTGRRRNWKKAYVCLKPGQEINFAAEH